MSTDEQTINLLQQILAELRYNRSQQPQSITLAEFCKRLGRPVSWGYRKVSERAIVPDRGGKPYLVGVDQLDNFK